MKSIELEWSKYMHVRKEVVYSVSISNCATHEGGYFLTATSLFLVGPEA